MIKDGPRSKGRMVRKQVLLTRELNADLIAMAAADRRPEGELVREALSEWLAKRSADAEARQKAMDSAFGIWANSGPTDEELAENRRRRGRRRDAMNARMRGEG